MLNSTRTSTPVHGVNMFGKGLSDTEMKRLRYVLSEPRDESEHRDLAVFLVLSSTGLRAHEIVNLKWSDGVHMSRGGQVFKYRAKGGAVRYTVPTAEALRAVRSYHRHAGIDADHWFHSLPLNRLNGGRSGLSTRSLRRIINSWGALTCRGRNAHPHAFRHTVGQRVFDRAGSLAAQKVLGHSSPATTGDFYTVPYYDARRILEWRERHDN